MEKYKKYIQEKLLGSTNSLKSIHTRNDGKWIKENNPELYEILSQNKGRSIPEKVFLFMNDMTEPPLCPTCKKNYLPFTTYSNGYKSYCSSKCSNGSKEKQEKAKKTYLERYGVDNPAKNNEIKEKVKETCNERYGGNAPICSQDVKDKMKKTSLEKYGTQYASQSPEVKEKVRETCNKRYNVNNVSQIKEKVSKKHGAKRIYKNIEKYSQECSERSKELWKNTEYREKVSTAVSEGQKRRWSKKDAVQPKKKKYYEGFKQSLLEQGYTPLTSLEEYCKVGAKMTSRCPNRPSSFSH